MPNGESWPGLRKNYADEYFCIQFFEYLKDHFETAWITNRKRAEDMLPKSVKYDPYLRALVDTRWLDRDATIFPLTKS